MSSPCTVLIAAQPLWSALVARLSGRGGEVIPFADSDTLAALAAVAERRPGVVAIERAFAASPRGAALINRIVADPTLAGTSVRIVAQDPVVDTPAPPRPDDAVVADGTRRVARVGVSGPVDTTIDGNAAVLVDLAVRGAQVVSPTVLRPNQRVRVALSDGTLTVRATGLIIWATFEIPPGSGPQYRAGIEFVNPDTAAIEQFCRAHAATGERGDARD